MASNTLTDALLSRRSVVARDLCEPGPNQDELDTILKCAHRVPDHGKIGPWRFIIFQDEARLAFGQELEKIFADENPDATDKVLEFEKERFMRAPLVIGVIYSPHEHPKVPEWEQQLSTGAVCQNILNAAHFLGYSAQWLTEWYAFNDNVNGILGLHPQEHVAGFIYIGSTKEKPSERNRPDLAERINYWQ